MLLFAPHLGLSNILAIYSGSIFFGKSQRWTLSSFNSVQAEKAETAPYFVVAQGKTWTTGAKNDSQLANGTCTDNDTASVHSGSKMLPKYNVYTYITFHLCEVILSYHSSNLRLFRLAYSKFSKECQIWNEPNILSCRFTIMLQVAKFNLISTCSKISNINLQVYATHTLHKKS